MTHLISVALLVLAFGTNSTIISPISTSTPISFTVQASSTSNNIEIFGGSSMKDSNEIEKNLPVIVAQVSSLEELDTWLKSQECIQSVRLENFLIKTNPPQREFIVEFKSKNGSTITKAIDIFVLGDERLRFNSVRNL
jgi:hypothetical protein